MRGKSIIRFSLKYHHYNNQQELKYHKTLNKISFLKKKVFKKHKHIDYNKPINLYNISSKIVLNLCIKFPINLNTQSKTK